MELSIEVLSILIKPLLSLAKDKWNKRSEFQTLRHLAYERLSRELLCNAEMTMLVTGRKSALLKEANCLES